MAVAIINPGGSSIGGLISGGTDGSVLFVHPAGTVAQNNPGFTYDATNGLSLTGPGSGVVLTINGGSGQSVDLLKFLNSSSALLTSVQKDGTILNQTTGVTNTTMKLNDTGLYFSRSSDGLYTTFVSTSQGVTPVMTIQASGNILLKPGNAAVTWTFSASDLTSPGGFIATSGSYASVANQILLLSCDPAAGVTDGIQAKIGIRNAQGTNAVMQWFYSTTELGRFSSNGNLGIGLTATAYLHIKAGTAAASTAPIKLTTGTNLTTAESGTIEYNNRHYFTNSSLIRFPVGGVLFDHFADANNGTTVETDLYSDTLVASSLGANGDKVRAQYGGTFSGAVASTQQLRAYFGGTLIFDSGALSIGAATDSWNLLVNVIRVSSSVVRCVSALTTNFATLSSYATYTEVTGLTLANTQILKITGQAAGAGALSNQITAKEGFVEWLSAA